MRRALILLALVALVPASLAQAAVTPTPAPSRLALFGHTAFVAPQGVGGIFVGCFGQRSCTGSMIISRSGVTLGQRGVFNVASNNGGIVHFTLSSRGRQLLRQRHQLPVEVTVAQSASGYYYHGNTTSAVVTLVQFI
ncbi:MAG: hypothetical protein ACLP8S_20370 [Solirubrobacteraceae bacterium]|jgi:hypothetical protein